MKFWQINDVESDDTTLMIGFIFGKYFYFFKTNKILWNTHNYFQREIQSGESFKWL